MAPPVVDPLAPRSGVITAADVANATCYQLDACASVGASCAVPSRKLAKPSGPYAATAPASTSPPVQDAASKSPIDPKPQGDARPSEPAAQLPSAKPHKQSAGWYLTPVQSRVPDSVVQAYGLSDALALLQDTRPAACDDQQQAGSSAAWYEQRRARKTPEAHAAAAGPPPAPGSAEQTKTTEHTKKRRRTKSKHAGAGDGRRPTQPAPVHAMDLFA